MASGRRVAGAIKSLVNARSLHESLLMPALTYGSETIWREKERSRIRAVQMDNIRGMLGFRRMKKVLNAQIRNLCGVTTKGVDEKIEEDVLQWFGHVERMKNNSTAKRVYI